MQVKGGIAMLLGAWAALLVMGSALLAGSSGFVLPT